MPLVHRNFPDEIWTRLKAWARTIAQGADTPTLEDCAAYVERVARDISGVPNLLQPDVVSFYAAEACEMIALFRGEPGVDPGTSAAQVV